MFSLKHFPGCYESEKSVIFTENKKMRPVLRRQAPGGPVPVNITLRMTAMFNYPARREESRVGSQLSLLLYSTIKDAQRGQKRKAKSAPSILALMEILCDNAHV